MGNNIIKLSEYILKNKELTQEEYNEHIHLFIYWIVFNSQFKDLNPSIDLNEIIPKLVNEYFDEETRQMMFEKIMNSIV